MKRVLYIVSAFLLLTAIGIAYADDDSVDRYIKDLKNADPEIRAKAAYELGCG